MITVLKNMRLKAVTTPEAATASQYQSEVLPLREALSRRYEDEAMLLQYAPLTEGGVGLRFSKRSIPNLGNIDPDKCFFNKNQYRMTTVFIDIDNK